MRDTRRPPAADDTGTTGTTGAPRPLDPAAERTRRRFARRQWARRWLAWRYVVAVALLLALVAGGLWLVFASSTLAVEQVQVQGERTLSEDEVRAAAAVPVGEPLARVDLTAITARVQALAVVRSATVTRHWPDGVTIAIVERTPVAVVDVSGRVRGMDAEGVLFRDYPHPPPGLPMVQTSTGTGPDALREAAEVVTALPDDLAVRVDHVDVATVDQISLVLRDGRTVEWGSAEESELKAEVLVPLLQHKAERYDVSVPGQPTTE
jgi:cell division protein FtsQ